MTSIHCRTRMLVYNYKLTLVSEHAGILKPMRTLYMIRQKIRTLDTHVSSPSQTDPPPPL